MSKDSREAAESALARLCEWRGLNCYDMSTRGYGIVMTSTRGDDNAQHFLEKWDIRTPAVL